MHPFAAGLALVIAMPQFHAAQSAGDISQTDVLATDTDQSERLTVPVKLGKNGPFRFMIDTGSQNTVVSNTLVSKLALVSNARAKLVGVAGFQTVDTVEIDEIALGRRSYYGLVAPVLQHRGMGSDGILGLDSLQDQRVLIDFRKGLMAVDDAKALGGNVGFDIVVTARRRSGQLILTNALIDGVRVDVVIDTGTDTTLGNRALQKALGRRGHVTSQSMLHSVTGQKLLADMGYANELKLQGATIQRVVLAFSDSPTFAHLGLGNKPAVFLGMREMRVFPRVAIDFKTRKVLFELPDASDPAYFGIDQHAKATHLKP